MTMASCAFGRHVHRTGHARPRCTVRRADFVTSKATPDVDYLLRTVASDKISATDLQSALAASGHLLSDSLKTITDFGASSIGRLAVFGDLWFANVLFALTIAISLLSLIQMAPKN